MMTSDDRPVLVVGAGPSGLTAALGLAVRGVPVRVVDAAEEGASTSRAAVVHAATLEVLDPLGATDPLLARALRVPTFEVLDGRRRLARLSFAELPTRFPFTAMLPQRETEEVLRTRLAELGVAVEWGSELVALEQDATGVDVRLRSTTGDRELRAALVVGADGGHSRTRELVGIGFPGARYEQSFLLADVTMAWPAGPDVVSLTFAPTGLVVVAPLPGGRHRVVATADAPPERPTGADVTALLHERSGTGLVQHVHWSGRFRVSHRLATTYRSGRVLLVGDAAHVHSPAGGQGMNTGIRDAARLADLVASGADLDRYEAVRRPVAARVVATTDRMTRAATLRGSVPRRVRDVVLATGSRVPALRRVVAAELAGLRHG